MECISVGIGKDEDVNDKEDYFPNSREWPTRKILDVSESATDGIPHCKGLWTKRCSK
jgi:hypothetical protein